MSDCDVAVTDDSSEAVTDGKAVNGVATAEMETEENYFEEDLGNKMFVWFFTLVKCSFTMPVLFS